MELTVVKDVDGYVVCILEGHVMPSPNVLEEYDTYGTTLLHVTHNPELDLSMTLDNAIDGSIGVIREVDA